MADVQADFIAPACGRPAGIYGHAEAALLQRRQQRRVVLIEFKTEKRAAQQHDVARHRLCGQLCQHILCGQHGNMTIIAEKGSLVIGMGHPDRQ